MRLKFKRYPFEDSEPMDEPVFHLQAQQALRIEEFFVDAPEGSYITHVSIANEDMTNDKPAFFPPMRPGSIIEVRCQGRVNSIEVECSIVEPMKDQNYLNGFQDLNLNEEKTSTETE